MRITRPNVFSLLSVTAIVAYLAAVIEGSLSYSMYRQAIEMREAGMTLSQAFGFFRGWRYIIAYPAFFLADGLAVDVNRVFSIVVGTVVIIAGVQIGRLAVIVSGDYASRLKRLVSMCLYIGISLSMNGRIAFAHLGMVLIMISLVRLEKREVSVIEFGTWCMVSLFLANVSSGTMLVVAAMVTYGFLGQARRASVLIARGVVSRAVLGLLSIVGIVALANLDRVTSNISYNLRYFGGGVSALRRMLEHGAGANLVGESLVLAFVAGLVVAATTAVLLMAALFNRRYRVPIVSMLVSLLAGLFGYSTMSMGIPGAIAIGAAGVAALPAWLLGASSPGRSGVMAPSSPGAPYHAVQPPSTRRF